jgi:uncharacterized protein (TIGR02145 family)
MKLSVIKFNIKMRILSVFFFIIVLGCKTEEPQNIILNSSTKVVEVKSKTGRIWMDRNLGASQVATSLTDEKAYGDLYQWGRLADGHQLRNSATTTTVSNTDVPLNSSFIAPISIPYDWRSPTNKNLWQGVNGINNVCPAGFRLPTKEEWRIEISSWDSNNAAGAFASPLKLTLAGYRSSSKVDSVGFSGKYWGSSTISIFSSLGNFSSSFINLKTNYIDGNISTSTSAGFSVRCLKD